MFDSQALDLKVTNTVLLISRPLVLKAQTHMGLTKCLAYLLYR